MIMAGGLGTRLRPLTNTVPKHILPVAGRPMIEYVVKSMIDSGFEDLILTTSHIYQKIVDVVGDGTQYGGRAFYSVESQRLGTAGSVKRVENLLDGTFAVGSGDVLADVNIKELYDFHRKSGAAATMALTEVENPTEYGIVGLNDDSRIVKFAEKPAESEVFSNLINAGIYILEPEALEHIPPETVFDFSRDLFPILLKKGVLYGRRISGLWKDVGRPSDLIDANRAMTERLGGAVFEGTMEGTAKGAVYVGRDAFVEKGAVLHNAFIYPGAVIRKGSMIQNSMVLDGSIVEEGSFIKDSIISWKTLVYPGTTIENTVLENGGIGE